MHATPSAETVTAEASALRGLRPPQVAQRPEVIAAEDLADGFLAEAALEHQLHEPGELRHVCMSRGVTMAPSQSLPSDAKSSPTVFTTCSM